MSSSDPKDFVEELKKQAKSAESLPGEGEDPTYVDPSDGTVYEWDAEKRGWFPKVGHTVWKNQVVLLIPWIATAI